MTFNEAGPSWTYSGTGDPRGCFSGGFLTSGTYSVRDGYLVTDFGVFGVSKRSNTEFLWELNSANPPNGYTVCKKTDVPPAPVNNLASSTVQSGIRLTWTDQSDNETGFEVERKRTSETSWTVVGTINTPNTTSFTDVLAAPATWQYRVFASNTYGRSQTSSVVQHSLITSDG